MTQATHHFGSSVKQRMAYALLMCGALGIGYFSRKWSVKGSFVHDYVGDAIWAAMIYFGYRVIFAQSAPLKSLVAALVTTYLIEASQLIQADWLNAVRHTRLGGLILGYVFLWSDLVMYSVGIVVAWTIDRICVRRVPITGKAP